MVGSSRSFRQDRGVPRSFALQVTILTFLSGNTLTLASLSGNILTLTSLSGRCSMAVRVAWHYQHLTSKTPHRTIIRWKFGFKWYYDTSLVLFCSINKIETNYATQLNSCNASELNSCHTTHAKHLNSHNSWCNTHTMYIIYHQIAIIIANPNSW